jgi:N-acetylglucosamine-6-phosphate deacetylase
MSENSDRQLITYISREMYARLQVFANLREISESEAIAQILADRLEVPYLSPSSISEHNEEAIEDEPDEILWDFIEPKCDRYDSDTIDEPDEVLMEFWED